jgi:hypothetical protein
MPGYSGTPLPKKLGIKPRFRVQLVTAPVDVQAELREALAGCETVPVGKSDDSAGVCARSAWPRDSWM